MRPQTKRNDDNLSSISLRSYMWDELTRGYFQKQNKSELSRKQEVVFNFISVPMNLESFLAVGFFACLDAFLYLFTFLPLRILFGLFTVILRTSTNSLRQTRNFDFARGLIMIQCVLVLDQLDSSQVYHWIRAQSTLKVYVIYNVIEIFDKLFMSFGQDIFDALFLALSPWKKKKPLGTIVCFVIAFIYVCIHSLLLFFKVITLNVAVNSQHGHALLTLLVSNQTVELKSMVYKNMNNSLLFQVTCTDALERFEIMVFLLIVISYNLHDTLWHLNSHVISNISWIVGLTVGSELGVDWIKHAFITKFNKIDPRVYRTYSTMLCLDILSKNTSSEDTGRDDDDEHKALDSSHVVARRIGFVPIPLACLVFRTIRHLLPWTVEEHGYFIIFCIFFIFWLNLTAIKILVRLLLLVKATSVVKQADKEENDGSFAELSLEQKNT